MSCLTVSAGFAIFCTAATALGQVTGPSTSQSPYVLPLGYAFDQGVRTISIATNGPNTFGVNADVFTRLNTGLTDYRLVGIPDGMGAFRTAQDITNGTFQLLVNHELGANTGIVRDHGGIPIQVGGTADHVHLLVTLRQQPALSEFLRDLKAGSSGWVHDTFPEASDFWWQTGYGAFTVSHSAIDAVKAYVANQEEHHKERTFQDEFRSLLVKHGIGFDEKYLWE